MALNISSSGAFQNGFVEEVRSRLVEGKALRRTLPGGRLRVDRPLPFLCVYRQSPKENVPQTERLLTGEASYLVVSGEKRFASDIQYLARQVIDELADEFGAFLLLEVWAARQPSSVVEEPQDVLRPSGPGFRILTLKKGYPSRTVEALRGALQNIRVNKQKGEVKLERLNKIAPPGLAPLISRTEAAAMNCFVLGLEVDPVWMNPETGELYPLLLNRFRRSFGRALKQTWFAFTAARTTRRPAHYNVLGPKSVTRTVWDVDSRLAAIDSSFDLLLAVTPVNPEPAWREFRRRRCQYAPEFYYRPIGIDPDLLKRQLYGIPIERIEDPTLAHLFNEKREELDRQLTMLHDRGTKRMRYESMQLFDVPSAELVQLAQAMLVELPRSDRDETKTQQVGADEFAAMANREYLHYRAELPEFVGNVQVRADISQGLLVSNGILLVGAGTRFPKNRAEALLQHEVGTHVLTYYNGKAQPLQQLYCGLAGYDEFQEGIAVLAEYLVNGLSRSRLRVLAARVIAVDMMLGKASFVDVFHALTHQFGFTQRSAFTITMRIFRGGGLTKDALYLRGLERVLEYLRNGGDVNALYVGKIAAHHVPIIRELQLRGVLRPTPLLPRYLSNPGAVERLERVRTGMTPLDLIPNRKSKRTQQ